MSNRAAAAVIAGIVLVIGIILAFVPISVSSGEVGCGSALSSDTSTASAAEFGDAIADAYRGGDGSDDGAYVALCDDRVFTQRLLAFPVVIVGALALLFLGLTTPHYQAQASSVNEPDAAPAD
ncbi:hypothetical protein ACI8AA_06960 [Geodermatophilus sp. SYSU D01180]